MRFEMNSSDLSCNDFREFLIFHPFKKASQALSELSLGFALINLPKFLAQTPTLFRFGATDLTNFEDFMKKTEDKGYSFK